MTEYTTRFGEVVDGKFDIVSYKGGAAKIAALSIDHITDGGDAVRMCLGDNSTMWNSNTNDATVMITNAKGGSGAILSTNHHTTTTNRVISFSIISGGSGYSSNATITITGGGAVGHATGEIDIVDGVITAARTTIGTGYTSAPTVVFDNDGTNGSGAAATCTINSAGKINTISITNAGSGYTSAPTILFNGGEGTIDAHGESIAYIGSGSTVTGVFLLSGSGYNSLEGNPSVTVVELSSGAKNITKCTDGTTNVVLERTGPQSVLGSTPNAIAYYAENLNGTAAANMIIGQHNRAPTPKNPVLTIYYFIIFYF